MMKRPPRTSCRACGVFLKRLRAPCTLCWPRGKRPFVSATAQGTGVRCGQLKVAQVRRRICWFDVVLKTLTALVMLARGAGIRAHASVAVQDGLEVRVVCHQLIAREVAAVRAGRPRHVHCNELVAGEPAHRLHHAAQVAPARHRPACACEERSTSMRVRGPQQGIPSECHATAAAAAHVEVVQVRSEQGGGEAWTRAGVAGIPARQRRMPGPPAKAHSLLGDVQVPARHHDDRHHHGVVAPALLRRLHGTRQGSG